MSIHKLSAGSGYDYLTRQVAALDATEKGHVGLASYYTERGETPGAWIGSGLAGIDGLNAGDAVTAEQMRALFGAGMHPLATTAVGAAGRRRLDRRKHRGSDPAGRAVQGLRRRGQPLPGRGGEADCRAADGGRTAGGRARLRGSSGAGPHRGGAGVLPKQSMAAIRSMPARSPPPSPSSRVRAPRRLPAMT